MAAWGLVFMSNNYRPVLWTEDSGSGLGVSEHRLGGPHLAFLLRQGCHRPDNCICNTFPGRQRRPAREPHSETTTEGMTAN